MRYIRYTWRVFWLARAADCVFVQGAVSEGLPATIGALVAGKKTVMRVPGDYAWEIYQQVSSGNTEFLDEFVTHRHAGRVRLLEAIERWTAKRAKRVIVPSRYVGRIVEQWGVEAERIRVVYSYTPPFPQTKSRGDLRRIFECEGKAVVLTAVRAVPWKGVDFLLQVLKKLPPHYLFVMAGDGPLLDELKKQADFLGLTEHCRFLGRISRPQLGEWYRAADLFVLASSYEGFPHVVVEAVMQGLPCLVSDRGGNPEVRDLFPEYVRILPYRDLEAWTKAMEPVPLRLPGETMQSAEEVAAKIWGILQEACKNP